MNENWLVHGLLIISGFSNFNNWSSKDEHGYYLYMVLLVLKSDLVIFFKVYFYRRSFQFKESLNLLLKDENLSFICLLKWLSTIQHLWLFFTNVILHCKYIAVWILPEAFSGFLVRGGEYEINCKVGPLPPYSFPYWKKNIH